MITKMEVDSSRGPFVFELQDWGVWKYTEGPILIPEGATLTIRGQRLITTYQWLWKLRRPCACCGETPQDYDNELAELLKPLEFSGDGRIIAESTRGRFLLGRGRGPWWVCEDGPVLAPNRRISLMGDSLFGESIYRWTVRITEECRGCGVRKREPEAYPSVVCDDGIGELLLEAVRRWETPKRPRRPYYVDPHKQQEA